jgi:hypothetical protein
MKRFFIVLFIAAASQYLFSQSSYLQLSLFDDGDFSVTFDNTSFGTGNYAEFDQVSPGEHSLKVMREGINVPPQGNVIFDGKVKIPAGQDIYAVIDEYNSLVVYKKKPFGEKRNIPYGENFYKCSGDGTKKEYDKKDDRTTTDECRYRIMKKEDFKELKSSVNNRAFESTNIDIIKTAIDANQFSAEQIRELLNYFTFESNKLEIAKYSYKKVCDTKNFFKVYDAFDFESSVQELKNYISGK